MSNDDYGLLQSALSSLNNSLASGANMILASQTSRRDRNFSREMSDLAWQRNIEAWNMQNEYNLPLNQYARQLQGIQANGLNPNLVYGNSSSVSGAAGGISPYKFEGYHSTSVPHISGPEPIQSFLSTRLLQTQISAQEANNRLINARADNEISRNPGIVAQSEEANARWLYKFNHPEEFAESLQGELAMRYWSGLNAETIAQMNAKKDNMLNYEMVIADWLNTAEAPGTGMTYRQYMEYCKAFLPENQIASLKAQVLNTASQIAYRAVQGKYLGLKMEYQTYVNQFAKYGRTLGNNWVNLIIAGLEKLGINLDDVPGISDVVGSSQENIPPTYPGP